MIAWLLIPLGFFVAILGFWFLVKKLEQIHILVNSRLSGALSEIRALKRALGLRADPTDGED